MQWRISLIIFVALLVGCSSKPEVAEKTVVDKGDFKVDTSHTARNAYPRVKVLVIHYTADDFAGSLTTLTEQNVSSHYLIPDTPPVSGGKPVIWQLVPESELAWHAGVSFWRGATRINDTSIGIELENKGFTRQGRGKQFYPFNAAQISVLEKLAKVIIARYNIEPQNVVAHADIAPQRKVDPGPLFPWQQLAQQGVGAWPDAHRVAFYLDGRGPYQPVDRRGLLDLLSRYGYQVTPDMAWEQQKRVIQAFQMHFRPTKYSGDADAQTEAIAEALLEKYGQG